LAGKRLSFWLAVAGVSLLTHFGLELASDRINSPGLQRLTAYTHKGAS
jgi:hypothetical protein